MYLNHSGWSFHTHGLLVAFFAVLRGEFYKKRLCSDVSLVIFEYLSKGTFKYSVAVLGRGWQGIHREPSALGQLVVQVPFSLVLHVPRMVPGRWHLLFEESTLSFQV